MTQKEELDKDIAAVQFSSARELDAEFAAMQTIFRDKETELNWGSRDKSILRLRGILRGNATEKYHDNLMQGIRQMVDGIVKSVESLRSTLALSALTLTAEIGIYLGKTLDSYISDRLFDCLFKCAGSTKKVIASASMKSTMILINNTSYYPKIFNQLSLMMNEKNNQVRLFTVTYTKTVLLAHGHKESTRALMERTNAVDLVVNILSKGLSDATPAVREACRESFWAFNEYWKDRSERLLQSLSPAIRRPLEKAKSTAVTNVRSRSHATDSRNGHSPTNSSSSLRTMSSLGSHRNVSDIHDAVSPSASSLSNGSTGSGDHHHVPDVKNVARSVSPRASSPSIRSTSPHYLRSYGSPTSIASHLQTSHLPSTSPPSSSRKTRVPALTRKKSTISGKRKLSLPAMLTNEDLTLRCEGLHLLARKLTGVPYDPNPDLGSLTIDGDATQFKEIVCDMLKEDNARLHEALSAWDAVAGIFLKLVPFEEYVVKLMLDASADPVSLKTEDDHARFENAKVALSRTKLYVKRHDPDVAGRLFDILVGFGGLGESAMRKPSVIGSDRKDPMRNPANRRKLTRQIFIWMDELVMPTLGLESNEDSNDALNDAQATEWLGDAQENVASQWFESDANIQHCLEKLLPFTATSAPGSIVHGPLVSLVGHLRLVNQKLFESLAASMENHVVNKVSRVLGIHIRIHPDYIRQATSTVPDQDRDLPTQASAEPTLPVAQEQPEEESSFPTPPKMDPPSPDNKPQTSKTSTNGFTSPPQESAPQTISSPTHRAVSPTAARSASLLSNQPTSPRQGASNHYPLSPRQIGVSGSFQAAQSPPTATLSPPSSHPIRLTHSTSGRPILDTLSRGFNNTRSMDTLTSNPNTVDVLNGHTMTGPPLNNPVFDEDDEIGLVSEHMVEPLAIPGPMVPPLHGPLLSPTSDSQATMERLIPPLESPPHHHTSNLAPSDEESTSRHTQTSFNGPMDSHTPHENSDAGHAVEDTHLMSRRGQQTDETMHVPKGVNGLWTQSSSPGSVATGGYGADGLVSSGEPLAAIETSPKSTVAFVSYFAPEKVENPWPVFDNNHRSVPAAGTMANGRNTKVSTLYSLVDKMKTMTADNATFRKLTRMAKESRVQRPWDEGGAEEPGNELWAGADHDGGNFVEVVQATLLYLDPDGVSTLTTSALELIRQMAVSQPGLFRFVEQKVDRQGMSLEARLIEQLLTVRASKDPAISTAAEDTLDALVETLSASNVFDVMMSFVIHRLLLAPSATNGWSTARYHPIGTAFVYLGLTVKEVGVAFFEDKWLHHGAVDAIVKGINHSNVHVRKSCVEAMAEFHCVLGDDLYQYLDALRTDQLNLVRHYAARVLKKRAGLASLSSTPTQFI